MVAVAVLRRRLADDLGEARTERAERRAADGDAGVGDRLPLTEKCLGPLDASRHQIGVGSLAVRRAELAREVRGGHQCGTRHGRDIEGQRVVAVDEVARPAQVHEVGDLLRRHADDGTRARDNAPTSKTEDHVAAQKTSSAAANKAAQKKAPAKKSASKKAAPKKASEEGDAEEGIEAGRLRRADRAVVRTVPAREAGAAREAARDRRSDRAERATSGLKWGVPFWTLDGKQLCDLVALKHEVALGIFAPPEAFDDPQGQLQGKSDEYRVLKVKHEDDIDAASVKRWLEGRGRRGDVINAWSSTRSGRRRP